MTTADQPYDADRDLSFEQVHAKYHVKIFDFVLRFIGPDNPDIAEDLTNETFTNA